MEIFLLAAGLISPYNSPCAQPLAKYRLHSDRVPLSTTGLTFSILLCTAAFAKRFFVEVMDNKGASLAWPSSNGAEGNVNTVIKRMWFTLIIPLSTLISNLHHALFFIPWQSMRASLSSFKTGD